MFTVTLQGGEELIAALNRVGASIIPVGTTEMQRAAEDIAQAMREVVPTETGSLQRSIGYNFKVEGNQITARIGPDDAELSGGHGQAVGRAIELGRPPGKAPPWQAIESRYGVGPAEAKAIAYSIAKKGTQGLHFIESTFGLTEGIMSERGIQIVQEIVNNFA